MSKVYQYVPIVRLIRLPNLVIVAATQYWLYYGFMVPCLMVAGVKPFFKPEMFHAFVIATICITAGGYIINDILDHLIDQENAPERVIYRKRMSSSTVYWLYFGFLMLGFIMAVYLAFLVRHISWLLIYPLAVSGLLLYSILLKKKYLLGNFFISLFCAAVPLILLLLELDGLKQLAGLDAGLYNRLLLVFLYYGAFAFLSNLMREMVKDMEDIKGDRMYGATTLPVVSGVGSAKKIALGVGILFGVAFILFAGIGRQWNYVDDIGLWGSLLLVLLPLACSIYELWKAEDKRGFGKSSTYLKLVMVAGLATLFFIYQQLHDTITL